MEDREVKVGYISFVEGSNRTKAINNYWTGGSQTGSFTQTITTDLLNKASLFNSIKDAEIICEWFNNKHKNKLTFEIIKVEIETIKRLKEV